MRSPTGRPPPLHVLRPGGVAVVQTESVRQSCCRYILDHQAHAATTHTSCLMCIVVSETYTVILLEFWTLHRSTSFKSVL